MMRLVMLIGLALAALGAAPANGQAAGSEFVSGNKLLTMCRDLNSEDIAFCYGYIGGVADGRGIGLIRPVDFCIPGGVSLRQLRDIAVSYLEAHPETRHGGAAFLMALALREPFPCAATQPPRP